MKGHIMKKIIFAILFACFLSLTSFASEVSYQLSTHILDVGKGQPAPNVTISLFKLSKDSDTWVKIAEGVTDNNGRIKNFLPETQSNDGIYKLKFETKSYFKKQGFTSIYPFVEVVFEINGTSHYHIPITMSANGYGTYRGN